MRNLSPQEIESTTAKIEYLGFAVIPAVLSAQEISMLLGKVTELHSRAGNLAKNSGASANQLKDKYVYHLQYRDVEFLNILTRTNLLDLLKPFLNDPYYAQLPKGDVNFLLAYYNARSSVDSLPLHIDSYVPSGGKYPNSMQIVISLNGQDRRNGATTVVPGSHHVLQYPDRVTPDIAQVVECVPGDVIVWDSRLWHGALENANGLDRWSLVATFRPWWMKQNFDPVRGLSEEMFAQLDNSQKALLGFLSMPAKDESEKISLKQGYADLLPSISDYKSR